MKLEWAARKSGGKHLQPPPMPVIPLEIRAGDEEESGRVLDWRPALSALLQAKSAQTKEDLALAFHRSLVLGAVELARWAGLENVVLSGGCFQNRLLSEELVAALTRAGFQAHIHNQLPPNDGCLAYGQAVAVAFQSREDLCA